MRCRRGGEGQEGEGRGTLSLGPSLILSTTSVSGDTPHWNREATWEEKYEKSVWIRQTVGSYEESPTVWIRQTVGRFISTWQ